MENDKWNMSLLLNNRYQIKQTLGSGGFGETYLAIDTHLPSQQLCVIKRLKPSADDPETLEIIKQRFQREAIILENLCKACPQIPKLHAYFVEHNEYYLVQDWIQGKTLKQKVKDDGLFTEADLRNFLISLLKVLEFIHSQNIIHRDIKPDNIIIREQDGLPYLIDFGAVKEIITYVSEDNSTTLTPSIVIGSPGYMPPEQAIGMPTFESDIYSLGFCAIFAATGKTPNELNDLHFKGTVWSAFAPHISKGLAAILDHATRPASTDRYPSARVMREALDLRDTIVVPSKDAEKLIGLNDTKPKSRTTLIAGMSLLSLFLLLFFLAASGLAIYFFIQWNQTYRNLSSERSLSNSYSNRTNEAERKATEAENKVKALSVDLAKCKGSAYFVVGIENRTEYTLPYQISNEDGTWTTITIKSKEIYYHWRQKEIYVKFDKSFEEGYTEQSYVLREATVYDHKPTDDEKEKSARYYFTLIGANGIEMYLEKK
jgi:serine/threonine protein kinase